MEILVRVRSAGVTPSEMRWVPTWTTQEGIPRKYPIIPGHEFSGEIAAVGPGVETFRTGDEVFGMNSWYQDGAQAGFCIAKPDAIARKPASVRHELAGSLPISLLTAWQGLTVHLKIVAGETVLVHGGAGAVGNLVVQMARLLGARVIATCAAKNMTLVRDLGADEAIDYQSEVFEQRVGHVEAVFDTVGGETLARSWSLVRPGGRLVTIATDAEQVTDDATRAAFFIVTPSAEQFAMTARLIDEGSLRPVADGVFPIARCRDAYEYKPAFGKAVITPGDAES